MNLKDVYSKMYLANIIVENEWGYHLEALWYGTDAKNLALMIMDVMSSWYLPNKDQFSPDITGFYERLEEATAENQEEKNPAKAISFKELTGEKFRANGLRLEVDATNNLFEMYKFVAGETFEIFADKGEKPDDFGSIMELADYMNRTYELDEPISNALKAPNEVSISAALYAIDLKYGYSQRHFRQQDN